MADEADDEGALDTDQWRAKTDFLVGVDFSQPAPELRYQLLQGTVHTIQLQPTGAVIRGRLEPRDLPFPTPEEGWYDFDGTFLGDDPGLPQD